MVKNTHGGNKHKQFARKHASELSTSTSVATRVSTDPCEVYAVVTRMLGNGMFHCLCMDRATRLGHMRGKFSGRGKRDNMVKVGTWVLVGLREWEQSSLSGRSGSVTTTITSASTTTSSKKMQHCDLLNVYSDADKIRLRSSVRDNWASFDACCDALSGQSDKLNDDLLRFTECDDEDDNHNLLHVAPQRIPVESNQSNKRTSTFTSTTIAEKKGNDDEDNEEDHLLNSTFTLDDI